MNKDALDILQGARNEVCNSDLPIDVKLYFFWFLCDAITAVICPGSL